MWASVQRPALVHTFGGLGQQPHYRTCPDNKPEQVQALVAALYALALRIKVLVDAREEPLAALLVRELGDDVRAWCILVEEQFRRWADDPEAALELAASAQDRLPTQLATLEARINETSSLGGEGELRAADYESFYRPARQLSGFVGNWDRVPAAGRKDHLGAVAGSAVLSAPDEGGHGARG